MAIQTRFLTLAGSSVAHHFIDYLRKAGGKRWKWENVGSAIS